MGRSCIAISLIGRIGVAFDAHRSSRIMLPIRSRGARSIAPLAARSGIRESASDPLVEQAAKPPNLRRQVGNPSVSG